ncbi:MAG: hypothetical protein C4313_07960, partial [Thermoflexus sp.]|uniref:sigma factor n=1 Tax=Thermoflexus sp. TaxID=1969742 RepID=UPI003326D177
MDRAEKMREAFGEFERVYGLVAQAAARVVRTVELPGWMEFEDVVQEGLRMACEAVGRWDPGRGRFTTYLYSRFGLYLRKVVWRGLPGWVEVVGWEEGEEGEEVGG